MVNQTSVHNDVLNQVAELLRKNNYFVKTEVRILLKDSSHFSLPFVAMMNQWYQPFLARVDVLGLKMRRNDALGVEVEGRKGMRISAASDSIAVEVSSSSDIRKEVAKLRRLEVDHRLIVTTDSTTFGEVSGIRVVPHDKLDAPTIRSLRRTYWCGIEKCIFYSHNWKSCNAHNKRHEDLESYRRFSEETTNPEDQEDYRREVKRLEYQVERDLDSLR